MWATVAAMLPAVAANTFLYGKAALYQTLIATLAAVITEHLFLRHNDGKISDGSAVIAGIIIGVSLPPLSPWFIAVAAAFFAIALGKHAFGGLGNNPFNPAMVGYALAFISFPAHFGDWLPPTVDGVSRATPLAASRLDIAAADTHQWLFPVAVAIGALPLIIARVADIRLALSFLIGATAITLFSGAPLPSLWQGGMIFAACFVITDPVTAPATPLARLIIGAAAGAMAAALRHFGAHTDGIAFAILAANLLAPLCDLIARKRR